MSISISTTIHIHLYSSRSDWRLKRVWRICPQCRVTAQTFPGTGTCVYLHSDTKLVYLILSFVCEVSNGVDVNMPSLATFSRGTSSKRGMSVRISCLLAISPPKQRVVFSPKQWCYFPHLPSGRALKILWRSFIPCHQWPSWLLYQLVLTPSIVTSSIPWPLSTARWQSNRCPAAIIPQTCYSKSACAPPSRCD